MKPWQWTISGVLGCIILGLVFVVYFLPLPESFWNPVGQTPTRIYDRNGILLYEAVGDQGRRVYPVTLEQIPPVVLQATILLEDKEFYRHSGIDTGAVVRAIWSNVRYGRVVSGASTIPQQVVRNILGTERERTLQAKLYESLLALRVSHVYSKEQVLELYFNLVFYGNNAYGIGAAAQEYFGKRLEDLDLAEIAMLVGLPQAPSRYNPILYPDRAKKRQEEVLRVLYEAEVITEDMYERARVQELRYRSSSVAIRAPHFVHYVLGEVRERYGQEAGEVVTTLDLDLYQRIQRIMEERVGALAEFHVSNAAVVVLENKTGEVVSFHGSVNYFDEQIHGRVSVPFAFRQPGSTLKPFIYGLAFEKGMVPATPVVDVEKRYFTEEGTPYLPKNYDNTTHGLVSIREALANSYNIPAVDMVYKLGVRSVVQVLQKSGVDMWGANNPDQLGLAVALGDGEVTLFALTNAYRMLANYGLMTPTSVLRSVDGENLSTVSRQEKVFTPEVAYLITNILSDNDARMEQFGEENFLKFPFAVAAKTGTTRNYRDNWVLGYSPYYTVGVWVGNADASSMQQVSGVTGAGPIFHDVMLALHANLPRREFYMPPSIQTVDVCKVSGLLPTEFCGRTVREVFPEEHIPKNYDGYWQKLSDGRVGIVYPPEVASWALERGLPVGERIEEETCVLRPHDRDRFLLVTDRPSEQQRIVFRACTDDVEWFLNEKSMGTGKELPWQLVEGVYTLRAVFGDHEEEVKFFVD